MQQFLVLFFFCIAWNMPAQSIQHLYLANDDHTDYMWTGNEVQYDSAFVKMLDYYLLQIDATKNNAPDFQTRFNCDGSYGCTFMKNTAARRSSIAWSPPFARGTSAARSTPS